MDRKRRLINDAMILDRRDVLIQDELKAKQPCDVWWLAHTAATVAIDATGRHAILQQGGKTLHATLLAPPQASFQIREAAPSPSSPHPERQADERHRSRLIRKLAVHLPGTSQTRIAVLFSPVAEAVAQIQPLARW